MLKPLYLLKLFSYLLLQIIGYCTVHSNIVQFNIDQSVGASANQLSAIVYWHIVSPPIVLAITKIRKCQFNELIPLVSYILSDDCTNRHMCLFVQSSSVTISSNNWLDATPHTINPIKLIAKVLNYAWNNKYPRNHSALTYGEEDYPS